MSWDEQAACRDVDEATKRAFASWEINKSHAQAALTAIGVCRRCPVTEPCLDDARERNDFGVRGGLMRLEPWSKSGHQELDADQLRVVEAFGTLNRRPQWEVDDGRSCTACGRRGLKRRPNGTIGRHIDLSHGGYCEGTEDGVA